MYCRKCGAECKETDRFCVKCGSSLHDEMIDSFKESQKNYGKINYKRIAIVLEILYFPLLMFLSIITWTEIGYKVSSWAGPYMATGISETTKVWLMILNLVIMAAIFLLLYVDKQTRGEKCKVRHYVITVFLFLFNMYWLISAANGI